MPDAAFFTRFGLFVRPGFLEPEACAALRETAGQSRSEAATVYVGDDYGLDPDVRRTRWCHVPPEAILPFRRRLGELLPELADHFGEPLRGMQGTQVLRYEVGDFFAPHSDRHAHGAERAARVGRQRRVSTILFLNDDRLAPDAGGYRGGALSFYGLLGPEGGGIGLPLEPETGLLVAFPSALVHGVAPVTAGERLSLVTWLTRRSPGS